MLGDITTSTMHRGKGKNELESAIDGVNGAWDGWGGELDWIKSPKFVSQPNLMQWLTLESSTQLNLITGF